MNNELLDVGASVPLVLPQNVPRSPRRAQKQQAYFFSLFLFDESSDFFELSDFWELSDLEELSDFEESSDFDLPSFFEDESPLEELEEEEGAEDFLA